MNENEKKIVMIVILAVALFGLLVLATFLIRNRPSKLELQEVRIKPNSQGLPNNCCDPAGCPGAVPATARNCSCIYDKACGTGDYIGVRWPEDQEIIKMIQKNIFGN